MLKKYLLRKKILKKEKVRKEVLPILQRLIAVFLILILLPILAYPFLQKSRYYGKTDPLIFLFGDIYLVDIGSGLIFFLLAFLILSRKNLLSIKVEKLNVNQSLAFGALSAGAFFAYIILRIYTSSNSDFVWSHPIITGVFALSIILTLVVLVVSVFLSIFGLGFMLDFIKKFRRNIIISAILFCIYLGLSNAIKSLWNFLSTVVAKCDYFLLGIFYDNAVLKIRWPDNPLLGVDKFVVSVGKDCSGIDSMVMFTGLFLLIAAVDWDVINKQRLALLYLPGLVGLFFVNVLRIFLLMLFGIIVSPDFAIGLFHSNAGWILFIAYFLFFWWLAYPWVKNEKAN
ncbi:MAG: archaeosortase/exosortase family protein [Candidatus Woesearchaeota archaeon]